MSLRICLNMIVKDEAAIIEVCLRSLLPVIDYYVICDTGSADGTPERVRDFFARHRVAGEIHHAPFVNFEVTRNQSLNLCRASAAAFDYILLADADMELFVGSPQFKGLLTEPSYALRQTNTISYYNTRLIRRDCPARYVGVTHEYLETDPPATRLTGAWFYDHANGANRASKFERDIALLEAALEQDPGNGRAMFYLAQSLKDCGRYAEAVEWYEKRILAGGWDEEVWYSMYMTALCHEKLGNEAEFFRHSLKAYNFRPHRAEPLYSLAKHYRLKGMSEACLTFCEAAARIPYPAGDSLFVEDYVYAAGIKEELSISGFYSGREARRRLGYDACAELTTSRQAGESARSTALRNFFFYAQGAGELFKDYAVKELAPPSPLPLPCTNPSIWLDEGGRHCVLRCVNYRIADDGRYHILDPHGVIRTQNYFLTLSESYDVAECGLMRGLSTDPPGHSFPIRGFEDCRLFFCRGRFWCVCTVRDRNPSGRSEMAVLSLDDDRNVTGVNVIRSYRPDLHQKNWVPLVRDDELYFIYSTDPTVILQYDFDSGQVGVIRSSAPEPCLEAFRGGSQAVRVRGGWIYLTHEARQITERTRSYLHRFVLLTDDFRVGAFTEPFYFLRKGIEFCAGLGYESESGRFVASFGCGDSQAYLAFFDADSVFSRLRDAAPGRVS
jgi:glycosyltransferase involved in cell wall biosynthesis